jgi:hypothetical protein
MKQQRSVLVCVKREEREGDPDHSVITLERHSLVPKVTPGAVMQRDARGVPHRLVEVTLTIRARKPIEFHPGREYLVTLEEVEELDI